LRQFVEFVFELVELEDDPAEGGWHGYAVDGHGSPVA
jgi:hypothetical protein